MARTAKRYRNPGGAGEKPSLSVGIYSRLSVDNHDHKAESVENQIEMINQFISSNNSNPDREMNFIVYDTYVDRGISGTSFDRNGFERLMQDVRERQVNCIIVKDLSRFGRDYLETGNLIEKILPFIGCRFIAVSDHFDSMAEDVNEGRLAMNIKNLVNDMYAKDISKRVAIARRMSAESGSFIGSFAPYGYEVVRAQGIRTLRINEECAAVVRSIFTLYSEGTSIREIISRLYQERVHRISDYKQYGHVYCTDGENLHPWSESSISRMLQNASYLGSLQQCKSRSRLYEGQKGITFAEEKDWVTVNHTHPAIVGGELFERVQKRKKGNQSERSAQGRSTDTENSYRNVLRCGCCGRVMQGVYYRSRVNDERRYAYYCRSVYRIDEGRCERNYIREEDITALVLKALRYTLKEQKVRVEDLTKLNMAEYETRVKEYALEERKICDESRCRKRLAAVMYGQYKEDMISRREYDAWKKRIREWEIRAEKRREEIRETVKRARCQAEEENQFLCALLRAEPCRKLNIPFVEAFIEKILIFPDGLIEIGFKFSDGGIQNEKSSRILPTIYGR